MPHLVFVLRFHPVFNYQALLKLAPQFSRLPSNVEISVGQSLVSDSSSATWAIYRGSTAIIEAIEQGAVPVYLARNLEMTIDPLFALEDGRQIIKTTDDLIQITNSGTDNSRGSQRAVAYCKELLSPLNIEILVDALGPKMGRVGL